MLIHSFSGKQITHMQTHAGAGHSTAVATSVIAVSSDSYLNEITREQEREGKSVTVPPPPLQSQTDGEVDLRCSKTTEWMKVKKGKRRGENR